MTKTLTIFTLPIIHLVYSPKILRENCFQFLLGIGIRSKNEILRQFPNCPKPLFQSAKCETIDKKLFFFFIPMQIEFFFKKGLASSLKWELLWTRKWPIEDCLICTILKDKQVVLWEKVKMVSVKSIDLNY